MTTVYLLSALVAIVAAQDQPLLSTIATVPELSSFSAIILASGGSRRNPAFEERFNSVLDGRNYTALAPTNDAINKIPPATVEALTAAPAYPIFESIIRTHIAEGLVTSTDLVGASPFIAIEGFALSAAAVGGEQAIFVNDQAKIVAVDMLASNGVVHQIDQVLNPYTDYFGISNTTAPPITSETGGTIADILLSDERLTTMREIMQTLSPDLVNSRLAQAKAGGKPQIFAAPSNDAFVGLPNNVVGASVAPSNQPVSLQIYSFGLLDTNARFSDLDFSGGPINIASAFTGINITASQAEGGAIFLNNAGIQEQVCGSNGCVWVIDRVLDPLYLAFGPLNRGGV